MPIADRAGFIELLKKLDGENDQDVVAAAREIARRMKEGGVAWEDVLIPAGGSAAPAADDEAAADEAGEAAPDAEPANDDSGEKAVDEATAKGDLALIRALLALKDLGESTRVDLQEFADDIAQGRFRPADSRYVRALHRRMIG